MINAELIARVEAWITDLNQNRDLRRDISIKQAYDLSADLRALLTAAQGQEWMDRYLAWAQAQHDVENTLGPCRRPLRQASPEWIDATRRLAACVHEARKIAGFVVPSPNPSAVEG